MGEPGYPSRTFPVLARTFPSSDAPVLASLGPSVRDGMQQAPSWGAGAAAGQQMSDEGGDGRTTAHAVYTGADTSSGSPERRGEAGRGSSSEAPQAGLDGQSRATGREGRREGGREGGRAHEPALATGLSLGARAHCTDGWASPDAAGMAARVISSSSSNLPSSSSPPSPSPSSLPNRLPPKEDKPAEKGHHEATSSRGGGVGGGGGGGGGQRECDDAGRAAERAERAEADKGGLGGGGVGEETHAVAGAVNGGLGAVDGGGGDRAPCSDAADGGMYVYTHVCTYMYVLTSPPIPSSLCDHIVILRPTFFLHRERGNPKGPS
jgi:hypothetical protein